jgi:hypothetical protein
MPAEVGQTKRDASFRDLNILRRREGRPRARLQALARAPIHRVF